VQIPIPTVPENDPGETYRQKQELKGHTDLPGTPVDRGPQERKERNDKSKAKGAVAKVAEARCAASEARVHDQTAPEPNGNVEDGQQRRGDDDRGLVVEIPQDDARHDLESNRADEPRSIWMTGGGQARKHARKERREHYRGEQKRDPSHVQAIPLGAERGTDHDLGDERRAQGSDQSGQRRTDQRRRKANGLPTGLRGLPSDAHDTFGIVTIGRRFCSTRSSVFCDEARPFAHVRSKNSSGRTGL
jgi:hypothetical protein